jgi:hypothetical protein
VKVFQLSFGSLPSLTSPFRESTGITLPLPFLSVRIGSWGAYLGMKIYGADSPTYTWLDPSEVYPGSIAMHLSARMTLKVD